MKNVMVTLISQKPDELSKFLNCFYNKNIIYDNNAFKWSCFFDNTAETIDLVSTLVDNNEKFNIESIVSLNKNISIKVTQENVEALIKLFILLQN